MLATTTVNTPTTNRDAWDEKANPRFGGTPLGFEAGDANVYRYVNNSPTNATDPSGMWFRIVPVMDWIEIQTQGGRTYRAATSADLINNLRAMRDNGEKIRLLVIKGHGGDEGICVGEDEVVLSVSTVNGRKRVMLGNRDITDLLADVSDIGTLISLRGCKTA